ncbi:hypothetical protein ABT354_23985 [Streptomyces sp. NPDC000594]|uniref:nSTAND1 domain-containing NTPase n=1 Tax=Streptomyces sp. NPDC000594 TaxID=3154261 RepID=UPI003318D78E
MPPAQREAFTAEVMGDPAAETERLTNRTRRTRLRDPTEIALVVDDLARARLLTLDDDTVDLAHEALITAWVRADRARLRAHRLLTEAEARRVAKVAEGLRHSDPRLAVRLSIAAWRIADATETRPALLGAVTQPERNTLEIPGIGSDAGSRHLTSDGRSLVVVEPARIERWDLRTSGCERDSSSPGVRLASAQMLTRAWR